MRLSLVCDSRGWTTSLSRGQGDDIYHPVSCHHDETTWPKEMMAVFGPSNASHILGTTRNALQAHAHSRSINKANKQSLVILPWTGNLDSA